MKTIPLHKNENLIDQLTKLLEDAKAGKVGACSIVYLDPTDNNAVYRIKHILSTTQYFYMIGAIEDMKLDLIRWWKS